MLDKVFFLSYNQNCEIDKKLSIYKIILAGGYLLWQDLHYQEIYIMEKVL